MKRLLTALFLSNVGHTYSNLSRLFLRMFVGVMFLTLCVSRITHLVELPPGFNGFLGMSPTASMTTLLVIESLCAASIILGFLTRYAVVIPILVMCLAEYVTLSSPAGQPAGLFSFQPFTFQPGYPVMFIGIFLFILLAGPGKISLDYVIAAYLIENRDDDEVLEKA